MNRHPGTWRRGRWPGSLAVPAAGLLMLAWGAAGASSLSDLEARGKQIYLKGTSPSGDPVTVFLGQEGFPAPASAAPCASCHGRDGRGRPEGGVIPSDITWANLTKRYGHRHPFGRSHPPFDEASVAASIRTGMDPGGNPIGEAMPLYGLSGRDMDALVAYLKRLEGDLDPGLDNKSIRLGTLLPAAGPGPAMAAVMQAYLERINGMGGIYGRRLELLVLPAGSAPADSMAALEQAARDPGLFALLAPYSVGLETELEGWAQQREIPVIGPYSPVSQPGSATQRQSFYLFAGPSDQLRALVRHAARADGGLAGLVVAGPDSPWAGERLKAVSAEARAAGLPEPASALYDPGRPDAGAIADALGPSSALFFLGDGRELVPILQALSAAGKIPPVYLAAGSATRDLMQVPGAFDGRLFVGYPAVPSDVDDRGRQAYADLAEAHALDQDFFAAQVAALAAGELLVEGLKRVGRDLSRESLVGALEGLDRFETGLTPPLSYHYNRRTGALGAHVMVLDLQRRSFRPAAPWLDLEKGDR